MDKSNKEFPSFEDDHDLTFTKDDRIETFKKIQENYNGKQDNGSTFFRIGKRYVGPILGTVLVLILAIGLLLPNLYSGNEMSQENPSKQQASTQEDFSFSALIMGEDSSDDSNHRSTINILLTYNNNDNSVKLVPIPRDTYVKIYDSEGKIIGEDKLAHASALNYPNPQAVLTTVSDLFTDISIDYYAVIPEGDIYGELGISKNEARNNPFTTNEIGYLMKERLSFSQIKNLLEESETNIPGEIINQFQMEEGNAESIQVIDMEKGIEETFINGIYYVEINEGLLETISNTLKQHLGDK
ncbi:LCP family protein [Oceanobacillus senegalensis]|uniref:LCP family protein n=1 Tax=Oceanobacillus senegalensis TaxID=1936063 RepID=UPI000A30B124|nr:LCP family protein [Oceanobacillus senegalensis]